MLRHISCVSGLLKYRPQSVAFTDTIGVQEDELGGEGDKGLCALVCHLEISMFCMISYRNEILIVGTQV